MSSHQTIKSFGNFDFTPDYIEGEGYRFEINCAEFLWADDRAEAMAFLLKVQRAAEAGRRKLAKMPKRVHPKPEDPPRRSKFGKKK